MFTGIDPIAQIILAIAICVAVVLIILIVIFKGITIRSDKLQVDVDGKKKKVKGPNDTVYYIFSADDMESIIEILSGFLEHLSEVSDYISLQKKMDLVENRMSLLYDYKNNFFSEKLVSKGVPLNCVTNHVDYLNYRQIVDRILYLDDGISPSVKSLLRKCLREKSYPNKSNLSEVDFKNKFAKFLDNIVEEAVQKTKKVWNDNYRSDVIDFDGKTNKKRIISVEEICEFEGNDFTMMVYKGLFEEIFTNAIEVDMWTIKERSIIKEDRKKQIQMFLLKRKE